MLGRFDPHQHIALILLQAVGVGCGTTVTVFEGEGQGGGDTTTTNSTTTTSTTSTTTTEYTCDIALPSPDHDLTYHCIDLGGGTCLDAGDQAVWTAMRQDLEYSDCESDPFCCKERWVEDIPCGPDPASENGCCYHVLTWTGEICMGRPFTIAGEARVAEVVARDDWARELAPALDDLDDEARAAHAARWLEDGQKEHASVASFARFALQLMSLGAPPDLLADTQRAMADEIRHAELCFGLASAYAGRRIGPGRLSMDQALGAEDVVAIALGCWTEGCIGETLAALDAHAAAGACHDRAVAKVHAIIARDETRHAELSWRALRWMMAQDDGRIRAALAPHVAALASHADRAVREVILPAAEALLQADSRVSSVISAGAPTRIGGPQKPVPQLT